MLWSLVVQTLQFRRGLAQPAHGAGSRARLSVFHGQQG
jgi:hypothetical protein